ncbi:MFS transporter [Streptosporangiaceae bacterium NEAU-GS5]|nr:MFS transporter [Streptosporangiaceae bacterium NEAU-GS5]
MKLGVLLGFALFGVFWGAWGAALPAVQAQANADDATFGGALLLIGVGALASMRLTGLLLDRYGRAVTPVVVVLFAACALAAGSAGSAPALAVTLFALGAMSGAFDVVINTAAVGYESATSRPLVSAAHAAFSAAVVAASALTGLARSAGATPLIIFAAVATVLCATTFAVRGITPPPTATHNPDLPPLTATHDTGPTTPATHNPAPPQLAIAHDTGPTEPTAIRDAGSKPATTRDPRPKRPAVHGLVLRRAAAIRRTASRGPASGHSARGRGRGRMPIQLLVFGAMGAVANLVENAQQSWSARHLEVTLRMPPQISGLGPSVFALATVTARLLGQAAAQRQISPRLVLATGGLLAAAGTATTALAPSAWICLVGVAIAGLGTGVCVPAILGAAGGSVPGERRGAAISTVMTVAYLGFAAGPAAVGLVAGHLGLRAALGAVAATAILLTISAPAVLPGRKPSPQAPHPPP